MRYYFCSSNRSMWYYCLFLSSTAAFVAVESFTTTSPSARTATFRILIPVLPTPPLQPLKTISKIDSCSTNTGARRSFRTQKKLITSAQMVTGFTDVWDAYNQALQLHPLIVKSVTASVILGLGDFAGQAVQSLQADDLGSSSSISISSSSSSRCNKGVDYNRAARFAIFGLILQAPWNHYYYLLLDGQIPPTVDEPFSGTNLLKVGIDQFIQAPIFTVLIFVFLGVLEGKAFDDIKKQLQKDYPETIVANWKLWIPATVINIAFVPPLFRVLYLNCVFFFWSIYLSLVLNKEEAEIDVSA